jgi:tetratricopeptide (TPR) repeat protein
VDLNAKFPDLRPIRSVPPVFELFGCGLLLYGQRDEDEETGSFVRTHYVCLLYVPLLALGAYRMVPADQGWYILGREPLSAGERVLTAAVLLLALGGGSVFGWSAYTHTPSYQARQALADGEVFAGSGRFPEAAHVFAGVATGPTDQAAGAARRIAELIDRPEVRRDGAALAGVLREAVAVQKAGRWPEPAAALYEKGMALVGDHTAPDPRGAYLVLEAVAPLAPKGDDLNAPRRELLERAVAAAPGDPEWVLRLAVLDESTGQPERSGKRLEPLRATLGTTEGARVLGLLDARAGRVEQALALLRPYTRERLDTLNAAEAELRKAVEAAQKRALDRLQSSRPPSDFDVEGYKAAGEGERQAILLRYLEQALKVDPDIRAAEGALESQSGVVPVALELGTLLLRHAQALTDTAARKAELGEAESTFLSVGRLAGRNLDYKLHLGQVYYWQGRHAEGRALFDEVLKARNRDPKLLVQVADLLRNLGSESEARALAEEGYRAATDAEVKRGGAVLRGLLGTEVDDRIEWLRRADPTEPWVKALLATDLAQQALEKGDEPGAIHHLREAVALYEGMPQTAATLNNTANALARLGALTGDAADFERGAAMVEKAAALEPGNSLLMANAARAHLSEALRDLIGGSLDLALLKEEAAVEQFYFLYRDGAGREALVRRVRAHGGLARALKQLEKAAILAPRNPLVYTPALKVAAFTEDVDALRALKRRLDEAGLDLEAETARTRKYFAGALDGELKGPIAASLARAQKVLEAAQSKGHGPTLAVAAVNLKQRRFQAGMVGLSEDRDAAVALAEEAERAAPSWATRNALTFALLERAVGRLAAADPALAALAERTRRATSADDLIAFILLTDGPSHEAIGSDPDVRRAAALAREALAADPTDPVNGAFWPLLRLGSASDPDAAALAKRYLGHEPSQLVRDCSAKLNPLSDAPAFSAFWSARMRGETGGAGLDGLKALAAQGVPVPVEAPKP